MKNPLSKGMNREEWRIVSLCTKRICSMRKFQGDERALTEALKEEVKARILESPNNNAVFAAG